MKISPERIKQIIKEELSHHHVHPERDDQEGARVKRHLQKIDRLVDELDPAFEEEEDVPEWIQEKIAVVTAMLQTILDYKHGESVR
jgi:hypothetical protein